MSALELDTPHGPARAHVDPVTDARATLVLGPATLNDDEPQAARHYEAAAEAFQRIAEAEGEVIARQKSSRELRIVGRQPLIGIVDRVAPERLMT